MTTPSVPTDTDTWRRMNPGVPLNPAPVPPAPVPPAITTTNTI